MNSSRRLPRSSAAKAVVASLALAAVAACGSSDESGDDAATESTPSAVATTTEAVEETRTIEETNPELEAYVDKVRTQSQGEMARFEKVYSHFDVASEGGDTLVYEYIFVNNLDPDTARTQIEDTRHLLETAAEPIFAEMRAVGVEDPKVRWTYSNPDGTELASIELP